VTQEITVWRKRRQKQCVLHRIAEELLCCHNMRSFFVRHNLFHKVHCSCCRAWLQWLRIGILCRLTWLTWQRSSVQQQSATNLDLIFIYSFFVTQTSGLCSIFNRSLLKFFHWKRRVYQVCFDMKEGSYTLFWDAWVAVKFASGLRIFLEGIQPLSFFVPGAQPVES